MVHDVLKSEIEAATGYQDLLVPALFQKWVTPVMDAARIAAGSSVLDVACGTGVLARAVVDRVGTTGMVAGVDPGRGMLAVAEQLGPTVEWREGTAESLPFSDQSFDAAVCQFGLMFFQDRIQALLEIFRVLKPGGHFAVAVWDSLDACPGYASEVEVLERIAGTRAADAVRAPFVLGSKDELTTLFENAGVDSVAITTQTGTAQFPSVRSMVEADLRGWLPVMGISLPERMIQEILAEAEACLDRYVTPQGEVVFKVAAHIVSGTKP